MISIIIPIYNNWTLTHNRLFELYRFIDPSKVEIIVVDDASPEEEEIRGGMFWWQKKLASHTIRYYRNPENLGFGGSCNNGVKLAKCDTICLLSNDVVVRGDFITQIEGKLSFDENILIGGRVLYFDTGWNRFNFDGKDTIIPYPEGWMIACKKDVWKKLGGFDPLYGRFDYEDMDLGMAAGQMGIKLVSLDSPYLEHLSGQTIRPLFPEREKITEQNRKKFFEKWKSKLAEVEVMKDGQR